MPISLTHDMVLTYHPQYGVRRQKERLSAVVAELEYVQHYDFGLV